MQIHIHFTHRNPWNSVIDGDTSCVMKVNSFILMTSIPKYELHADEGRIHVTQKLENEYTAGPRDQRGGLLSRNFIIFFKYSMMGAITT